MSPEERQLLAGLFERTRSAGSAQRDQEAESFINEQVKSQPAAPYLLAQTVLVQDQALQAANQRLQEFEGRIRELESRPQQSGFLGGLFGGGARQAPPPRPASPPPGYGQQASQPQQQGGPWGAGPSGGAPYAQPGYAPPQGYPQQQPPQQQQGGGFLKGALGTAAGVAGGVLLADSIRGLFHGGGGAGNNLGIGSGFEHAGGGGETIINNYYGDQGDQYPNAGYDDGPGQDGPDIQNADYSDDSGFGGDDGGGDGGFDV